MAAAPLQVLGLSYPRPHHTVGAVKLNKQHTTLQTACAAAERDVADAATAIATATNDTTPARTKQMKAMKARLDAAAEKQLGAKFALSIEPHV